MGFGQIFIFPAPGESVAFGDLQRRRFFLCFLHVTAHIPAGKIDIDIGCQHPFFAFNGGGTLDDIEIRYLAEGNLQNRRWCRHSSRSGDWCRLAIGHHNGHEDTFELLHIIA